MKIPVVAVAILAFVGLPQSTWSQTGEMSIEQFDVDVHISDDMLKARSRPKVRPFLMGFTYQPYDWNEKAFEKTFGYLRKHGELITLFHDVGIPWEEALSGAPLPRGHEEELQRQQAGAAPFEHVVVMLSVLGPNRVSLSPSLTAAGTVARSGAWAGRTFSDKQVITAYLRYARDLIRRFQPRYFSYVAEFDAAFTDPNDPRFQHLLTFSRVVYTTLKKEYPELIVFAEFTLNDDAYMAERQDVIDLMLPFSDLFAVSTYPDITDGIGGDASKIPANWFSRARRIAPSKPFAVLESGFIASPFMHPTLGVRVQGRKDRLLIPGGSKSQALFSLKLLEAADELDAEFINLWAVRDLDQLFERLSPDGETSPSMLRTAQDRGLYDEAGRARPSLEIWESWRRLPVGKRRSGSEAEATGGSAESRRPDDS